MLRAKPVRNAEGLRRSFLVLSFGLLVAGCSDKGDVSGKVTYNGKPLPGGIVTFFPSSRGGVFNAKINEDGSYSLSKVPAGKMKITVVSTSSKPPLSPMAKKMAQQMKAKKHEFTKEELDKMPAEYRAALDPSSGPEKRVPIPPKYVDPEKSGLEYTVLDGKQEHNIELK
ncbi:MAG TPA: carboxypeptidase-like regulatory domain-containing protein [Gemmataceae bacterium]|jgi:hypothetical protein